MKNNEQTMICVKCKEENIPFFSSSNNEMMKEFNNSQSLTFNNSIKSFYKGINQFNNNQTRDDDDDNLPLDCEYFGIDEFKFQNNKHDFSLFHLNIASLAKHKEELETIFTMLNFKFDVIGISETKIKKNIAPIYDVSLKGYNSHCTPTESERGGVSLYIADHHKCKLKNDLDTLAYKTNELESVFIEIINPREKNIIIGCIYRHPSMDLHEFNDNYLNPVLDKSMAENKQIFLTGDFNVDLMKTDSDYNTSNFFDTITSNLFVPHIIYPTRITPNSKMLIDNIFSNSLNFSQGNSGNLTLSISDHLAQFLIIPMDYEFVPKKANLFKRETKNFDRENFIIDLLNIDWPSILKLEKEDPGYSFNSYEAKINTLIDKYMPLKRLTKREIKQQYKPWITNGIRKSIKRREKYYKKFIKAKDEVIKEDYHSKYKEIRNAIVTLCRQSKKMHFQKFFLENANNAKKTWKGIKSIINVNSSMNCQPISLLVNNELITEPKDIANAFNNYF